MAEYINVEKPFLDKLKEIHWHVIDHGAYGIPADPKTSLRSTFGEVTLKETFKESVRSINLVDSKPWLTDSQLDTLYNEVTAMEKQHMPLLESNKHIHELLTGVQKTTVALNEVTGEQDVQVQLIDFEHWDRNSFIAINQFRVVTPGGPREGIIPDIVCFINGLPVIVIECKDTDVAQPLSEAFIQISRYSNTRDEDSFAVKEGEERLFHYNIFSIITHGTEARVGSITGGFEYYLNWKDIFPETYWVNAGGQIAADPDIPYGNNQKSSKLHQNIMIAGMLNKEILVDVLRHFTLFMEIKKGVEIKIISRYQQYRAVGKMIRRLREGKTPDERSGVVWHTQGSGKSLTMIFLIRKLRSQADLRDYKVIMMVDRTSLERQLSETAMLTGEFKDQNVVGSRKEVSKKLSTNNSDLHMVMIHKFIQEDLKHSKALMKAYKTEGMVPIFKPFDVINTSDRIVILIDEAHRSQGGDMGNNFFKAFPNAVKIAFTGTPLLTDRHKQKTHERFGGNDDFIDTYKIREAVDDRATLDIIYVGKTTKDQVKDREAFDRAFEDEFKERTKEEKEIIQSKYGTMQAYLENEDRLTKISEDLVKHFIKDILPNGYKAMVVASSVIAAARYEILINKEIAKWIVKEESKSEPDQELLLKLKMIDACTEVTMTENNELSYISAARKKAKNKKAIDNFKKDFDFSVDEEGIYLKPETGISFLCVCDRLLTGFDAPIAQVMYLDKNLKEHNLLQAIARVNRTKGLKEHGILIDYYGVSNHLRDALNIWGAEDEEDIKELLAYFRDINKEIPVLEARYNRLIQLFEDKGVKEFKAFATQMLSDPERDFEVAEQCVDLAKSVPFRAQFDTYLKAFFDSLDLLFNSQVANDYYIPAKRFGYLLMRIRNRYQDSTLDLKWAKAKVRKMIDEHLKTLKIDSRIPPVSLLSKDFPTEIDKLRGNAKSKASQMEHAIRRHIKVNGEKDPAMYNRFYKRMEDVLAKYRDNWTTQVELLEQLRKDMAAGREVEKIDGVSDAEAPFFDLLIMESFGESIISDDQMEEIKKTISDVVESLKDSLNTPMFWKRDSNIRSLRGDIELQLLSSDLTEISDNNEYLANSILQLAKRRHEELIGE